MMKRSPQADLVSRLLALNEAAARSWPCFFLGLGLTVAGAGLAFGIMAYEAIANGVDYTAESWVLIAPLWLGLAVLWVFLQRWPLPAGVLFGALALYAGGYFSDVYGQFVSGALLLLGSIVLLASATSRKSLRVSEEATRDAGP